MNHDQCGVYEIRCVVSGKTYVGSSMNMVKRWQQHRTRLRRGDHPSPRLQQAWRKHGESKFVFSILERCAEDERHVREQFYIDMRKRDYNSMPIVTIITKEMRAKMIAGIRAFAVAKTHCPHGHEYTELNTYRGTKGERICRACNRNRVANIYATETPEQTKIRRIRGSEYHQRNRTEILVKQRRYAASHAREKRAYDLTHRAEINGHRRRRRASMTEEQRARHREQKRASYARCK